MTEVGLSKINQWLKELDFNYAFGEWNDELKYPYAVGSYTETESMTEDGMQESDFLVSCFTRGLFKDLENIKAEIRRKFDGRMFVDNVSGTAIVVDYATGMPIPTNDASLKRMEIHLTVKEWMVE